MICCDTCPYSPTCEEVDAEEEPWGEEYQVLYQSEGEMLDDD